MGVQLPKLVKHTRGVECGRVTLSLLNNSSWKTYLKHSIDKKKKESRLIVNI